MRYSWEWHSCEPVGLEVGGTLFGLLGSRSLIPFVDESARLGLAARQAAERHCGDIDSQSEPSIQRFGNGNGYILIATFNGGLFADGNPAKVGRRGVSAF